MIGEPPQDPKPHWEALAAAPSESVEAAPGLPGAGRALDASGGGWRRPADDTPRLWFDHAAAAQFDWTPAYTQMRQHLVNCEDVDAIYAFGVECLKTGRYDTDVPWRFLVVLSDIQLVTKSDAYWRRPEVYANLCEFFRKNAQDTRNKNMDFFHSQEALLAYGAGHFQDARKALDKVGDRMVKHGVFLVNAGNVDLAMGRTYALTGPLAAQVQTMEKADQAGQVEQAAQSCRQMLAALDRADKGRPYLRDRLATTQIEARCAAGEWTPIQPDADLAGWSATVGQWSVDDKGGLVGKWNPSDPCAAMLLCHAKIGPNFEVMGHAEVVESDGGGSFGAILSFANRQSFWECSFYPAVTADTGERLHLPLGNQAYVRMCRAPQSAQPPGQSRRAAMISACRCSTGAWPRPSAPRSIARMCRSSSLWTTILPQAIHPGACVPTAEFSRAGTRRLPTHNSRPCEAVSVWNLRSEAPRS